MTLTQDEGVTLSALMEAAKAIPVRPDPDKGLRNYYFAKSEWAHARAEFWRLAWRWESLKHTFVEDIKAREIIAEVEARS